MPERPTSTRRLRLLYTAVVLAERHDELRAAHADLAEGTHALRAEAALARRRARALRCARRAGPRS